MTQPSTPAPSEAGTVCTFAGVPVTRRMIQILRSANPMNCYIDAFVGDEETAMIEAGMIWHDEDNAGDYFTTPEGAAWIGQYDAMYGDTFTDLVDS